MIFLPFIFCRFYEAFSSKKIKQALFGLFQDFFVCCEILFLLPRLPILWSVLIFYQLLGWYLAFHFEIPLTANLWTYVSSLGSFKDSARSMKAGRRIGLMLLLTGLSLIDWPRSIPIGVFIFSTAGAFLGYAFTKVKNPLFEAQFGSLFLLFNKKKKSSYKWLFPNERAAFISPAYPLLRKTNEFTGEKQFEQIKKEKKPHVIFLFLESFRGKNVGCLGAEKSASPHFDKLSKEGVLFTRFYANGLLTFRAFISSLFGIPPHLKTATLNSYCSLPLVSLAEILAKEGYHTALIQGGLTGFDHTLPFAQSHGFKTILGKSDIPARPEEKTSWGIHDEVLLRFAADWLKKQKDPAFLCSFTITNHHPWDCPNREKSPPSYESFLRTFAYSDFCLSLFVEELKKESLLDKSILFILGDHGQEMGERHSRLAVQGDLYEENIHVPLLILGNGIKPARIDAPSSQVDLLPTVLDLLEIPAIHHSVGTSLLRKTKRPVFFSLSWKADHFGCIEGHSKFIQSSKEELYDLSKDKGETINLAPSSLSCELKEKTSSFFTSVETIYKTQSWAPPSLQTSAYKILSAPDMNDADWTCFLLKQTPSPIIDLSHADRLTDRAVFAIGKEKSLFLREINLSHSPLFTDRSLHWIGENCPQLSYLNASYCPLITDLGVHAILKNCRYLSVLKLEGNQDLISFDAIENTLVLEALDARECFSLKIDHLARFISKTPQLLYLGVSLKNGKSEDLIQIGLNAKGLVDCALTEGKSIHPDALSFFCKNNPLLGSLHLDGFSSLPVEKNKELRLLHIANSSITDASLEALKDLPIKQLALTRCPNITTEGLARFSFRMQISECENIDKKQLLRDRDPLVNFR